MKAIMSAVLGLVLSVSAAAHAGAPVSAINPALYDTGPGSLIKVQLRCREWVSICLKRFGPRSPRYGECLRNHGC
jgi:hypothetical protein